MSLPETSPHTPPQPSATFEDIELGHVSKTHPESEIQVQSSVSADTPSSTMMDLERQEQFGTHGPSKLRLLKLKLKDWNRGRRLWWGGLGVLLVATVVWLIPFMIVRSHAGSN